jgi:hypothetical protein
MQHLHAATRPGTASQALGPNSTFGAGQHHGQRSLSGGRGIAQLQWCHYRSSHRCHHSPKSNDYSVGNRLPHRLVRALGIIPSWAPHTQVEHMRGPCGFKVCDNIRPCLQALLVANPRDVPNARDTASRKWLHLHQKQSSFRAIGSSRARTMLIGSAECTESVGWLMDWGSLMLGEYDVFGAVAANIEQSPRSERKSVKVPARCNIHIKEQSKVSHYCSNSTQESRGKQRSCGFHERRVSTVHLAP